VNIRLEEHKLCLLVLIGVRADGRKELIALADGHRESAESWADLLRDCARRGMRAPVLAAGDGALGFWGALREAFPETREQRCWFRKAAKVHLRTTNPIESTFATVRHRTKVTKGQAHGRPSWPRRSS
jgi:putative transposase